MTKDYIAVGKLLSPFAVRGGVKVKSFSGVITHFKNLVGSTILLVKENERRNIKVIDVVLKGETAIFFFESFDSPEAVKILGGFEIWVKRRYGLSLDPDEFYMSDFIGCNVFWKGDVIAIIVAYIEASTLMLEAQKNDGSTFFIPFISHFIGDIDLSKQSIVLLNDESM